ncbi:hypothetical protein ACTFQF_15860 [Aliivibrio fischeri]|uniref:Uncharacterized protein n=4 Tax=Aliivibrio fischeri TaxID=668 RepID=Q5E3K2_ALIF1|nr:MULTISPECIES: hypothetical protein [Aliivibrio]AAW86394.1 hypothetical protein VF_1899 [Aliivibrio fischeri ES114]ACH66341.1 conserved hypothetical protein [Aliivibrio fischeri MJ11]EHN70344.1 hypothetical protein VFSR5_2002 [Aliivibrio fischeri SR5]KLU79317.1 hypothetical protein AB192_07210 [Aliivibrio fischeri]MBD1569099.1 hypothetical protein [Aliivibrio sp. S10_S31]
MDLSTGALLFSALLSPLAMADWQLDLGVEINRPDLQRITNSSASLVLGEETLVFNSIDKQSQVQAWAELKNIDAENVEIAFRVTEEEGEGKIRTLCAPTIITKLNNQESYMVSDSSVNETVKLSVEVISS